MNKSLFKFLNIVKELSFHFSKQKFKKMFFENQKNVGIKYFFALVPPILIKSNYLKITWKRSYICIIKNRWENIYFFKQGTHSIQF